MRILVLEDDGELANWLRQSLSKAFGTVDIVASIDAARAAIAVSSFELIILDRRLPDGDGASLLTEIRSLRPRPGTIMLTALDDPNDVTEALDRGADDYVGKPFEPSELVARARAVLRRCALENQSRIEIANLRFDVLDRSVYCDEAPLVLPRRELAILDLLARKVDRVVLRDALEAAVYTFDDEIQSNALDSHVSRLRKRLRQSGCRVMIRSIRGVGYMLTADEA